MQNISNDFKNAVKSNARTLKARVHIKESLSDLWTEISENDLISFEWRRDMQASEVLTGSAVCQYLNIKLYSLQKQYESLRAGSYIKLDISAADAEDSVSSPSFIIDEITRDDISKTIEIKGYDLLYTMNAAMNTVFDMDGEHPELADSPWDENVTAIGYAVRVCSNFGVSFDSSLIDGFYTPDMPLTAEPNLSGNESAREVIGKLAQIYFANVMMTKDDALCFVPLVSDAAAVQIGPDDYFEFIHKGEMPAINTLCLAMEPQQDYIIRTADPVPAAVSEFKITNNPFLDFQRDAVIDENEEITIIDLMFSKIAGFSASAYEMNWRDYLYLEPGDTVSFIASLDSNSPVVINSFMGNTALSFDGGVQSKVSLSFEGEDSDLTLASSIKEDTRRTELSVDKLNGQISSLTTTTKQLSTALEESITQTNKLIQSASDGLVNTFQTTGGSNLLRNSALLFGKDNGYENWLNGDSSYTDSQGEAYEYGRLKRTVKDEAVSRTAMLLQQSTGVYQTTALNAGKYYLKFSYDNQGSALASASLTINNTVWPLNPSGTFEHPIIMNSAGAVTISFACDTDDKYLIWDLMLNRGDMSVGWSQYANEMKTDTVSISEGIQVESSSAGTDRKSVV